MARTYTQRIKTKCKREGCENNTYSNQTSICDECLAKEIQNSKDEYEIFSKEFDERYLKHKSENVNKIYKMKKEMNTKVQNNSKLTPQLQEILEKMKQKSKEENKPEPIVIYRRKRFLDAIEKYQKAIQEITSKNIEKKKHRAILYKEYGLAYETQKRVEQAIYFPGTILYKEEKRNERSDKGTPRGKYEMKEDRMPLPPETLKWAETDTNSSNFVQNKPTIESINLVETLPIMKGEEECERLEQEIEMLLSEIEDLKKEKVEKTQKEKIRELRKYFLYELDVWKADYSDLDQLGDIMKFLKSKLHFG